MVAETAIMTEERRETVQATSQDRAMATTRGKEWKEDRNKVTVHRKETVSKDLKDKEDLSKTTDSNVSKTSVRNKAGKATGNHRDVRAATVSSRTTDKDSNVHNRANNKVARERASNKADKDNRLLHKNVRARIRLL